MVGLAQMRAYLAEGLMRLRRMGMPIEVVPGGMRSSLGYSGRRYCAWVRSHLMFRPAQTRPKMSSWSSKEMESSRPLARSNPL